MEKRKFKTYPEPGVWVLDTTHGIPDPKPPDHDITQPLTVDQVRDEVIYHGLGFCICDWLQPKFIKDKKLRLLWVQARNLLREIRNHLDEDSKPKQKPKQVTQGKRLL